MSNVEFRLDVPILPPSMNSAYPSNLSTGRRFKSAEYRAFEEQLGVYVARKVFSPLKGPLIAEYNFYFPDKRRRDVGNYEKCLTDVLVKCGVMEDDSQIIKLILEKFAGPASTVVSIRPAPTHKTT